MTQRSQNGEHGAGWPDVALAAFRHPVLSLLLALAAASMALACQLGYHIHRDAKPATQEINHEAP